MQKHVLTKEEQTSLQKEIERDKKIIAASIIIAAGFGLAVLALQSFYWQYAVPWIIINIIALTIFAMTIGKVRDRARQSNGPWKKLAEKERTAERRERTRVITFLILQTGMIEILSTMPSNVIYVLNVIICLLMLGGVFSVFGMLLCNTRRAMIAVNIISSVLGLVNHYYAKFRSDPFELADILMTKTAAEVLEQYKLTPDTSVFIWLLFETAFVILWRMTKDETRMNIKRSELAIFAISGILLIRTYHPDISYWAEWQTVNKLGYIPSFVAFAKNDFSISEPDGYTTEKAAEILQKYDKTDAESGTSGEQPDIIVVMNESLTDLPAMYGFETNEDCMPFIHSLSENTVKGNVLTSSIGGGTCNTEWEFLTGGSMAFLGTNSVPYMQYISENKESIARELKGSGYLTTAFHPFTEISYDRNKVYPLLGFDEFVTLEDGLKYSEPLGYLRSVELGSDNADIKNLIDIYEKNKGTPQFIFNVTIQNHGNYSTNEENTRVPITTYATDESLQKTQISEYLSLVRKSDSAIETLIEYYKTVDRPVILLVFGDHQPKFLDNEENALQESYEANKVADANTYQYQTPFVMWANFDIEGKNDMLISPGYLRALLKNTAGMRLGSYEKFLLACREEYPAINAYGYYDSDMVWHSMEDGIEGTMLEEYSILQYSKTFDKTIDISVYD